MNQANNTLNLRGWWIAPDGEVIAIDNHFEYVIKNPAKFGLSAGDVKDGSSLSLGKERQKYIRLACEKGWIRVRERKGYTAYEFWEQSASVLARVRKHLETFKYSPADTLHMNEMSKNKVSELKVWGFMRIAGRLQM